MAKRTIDPGAEAPLATVIDHIWEDIEVLESKVSGLANVAIPSHEPELMPDPKELAASQVFDDPVDFNDVVDFSGGSTTGIDHGALSGLTDDDHVRYFDKDGSKDMTEVLHAVTLGASNDPGIGFVGDTDTGFMQAGSRADSIGFMTGGTERWRVENAQFGPITTDYPSIGDSVALVGDVWAKAYRGVVLQAFAFSSGTYNVGSSDDHMGEYDVVLPANLLQSPGDHIVIETALVFAVNANQKTCRIQLDSGTSRIVCQTSVSLANMIVRVTTRLFYRTSTSGSWGGVTHIDASAASPISGQGYLANAGMTSGDWTAAQTLKFWCQGGASNDLRVTDYSVTAFIGHNGTAI